MLYMPEKNYTEWQKKKVKNNKKAEICRSIEESYACNYCISCMKKQILTYCIIMEENLEDYMACYSSVNNTLTHFKC